MIPRFLNAKGFYVNAGVRQLRNGILNTSACDFLPLLSSFGGD